MKFYNSDVTSYEEMVIDPEEVKLNIIKENKRLNDILDYFDNYLLFWHKEFEDDTYYDVYKQPLEILRELRKSNNTDILLIEKYKELFFVHNTEDVIKKINEIRKDEENVEGK